MHIIGIAGKAESGKDTAAGFITTVYPHRYYRRGFADALKRDALAQWSRDHGPYTPEVVAAMPVERVLACANLLKSGNAAFRSLLQDLGKARRATDPDYWVSRLLRDHMEYSRYGLIQMVVPDVRFPNEVDAITYLGGLVLRLERPGHENRLTPEQRADISETALDDWEEGPQYRIIENHGNPVELLRAVLLVVDNFNSWRR